MTKATPEQFSTLKSIVLCSLADVNHITNVIPDSVDFFNRFSGFTYRLSVISGDDVVNSRLSIEQCITWEAIDLSFNTFNSSTPFDLIEASVGLAIKKLNLAVMGGK